MPTRSKSSGRPVATRIPRSVPRPPSPLGGPTAPRSDPTPSAVDLPDANVPAHERGHSAPRSVVRLRGSEPNPSDVPSSPGVPPGHQLIARVGIPEMRAFMKKHKTRTTLSVADRLAKLCSSDHRIAKSNQSAFREALRRHEGGPCVGEPYLESPLPKVDILVGWQAHRRITLTWRALEMFFEGDDEVDRLSFRRAQRIGTKAVKAAYVHRSLGSYFVPMRVRCDHAFVDSAAEAIFITELHLWSCALLGDEHAGLHFVVDLHDRSPIFQQVSDVNGASSNDVQLAWELSSAMKRYIDPLDLWFVLKSSSMEALRKLGSTHSIISRGFHPAVNMAAIIPPELDVWWPPVGMVVAESKVLRYFSSMLGSPRAQRGTESDARFDRRRRRVLGAARFEKLIIMLQAVDSEITCHRRVPKIEQGLIRHLVDDAHSFLNGQCRWSWRPNAPAWEHLIALLSYVDQSFIKTTIQVKSWLHGEVFHYVNISDIDHSMSIVIQPSIDQSTPRQARDAPIKPNDEQAENSPKDQPKSALKDREAAVPVGDSGLTVEVGSVPTRASMASQCSDEVGQEMVGPRSNRKILLTVTSTNTYCMRTHELLSAYPGLRTGLTHLKADDLEFVNLREVLQGASGALRIAETGNPGVIRAARGGSKGTQQSRRNAALTVENHELKEQNVDLRRRLDDALAQVGRLGVLALEAGACSVPSRQRRSRDDDRADERPLKRPRN